MTKFILTRSGQLPVYVLHDRESQSIGFQGYDKIPTQFGLVFPECGGTMFHMQNVGDRLLAVGLEDIGGGEYRVVSSDIWEPDSVSLKHGGDVVLECSVEYKEDFPVGRKILMSDEPLPFEDPRARS